MIRNIGRKPSGLLMAAGLVAAAAGCGGKTDEAASAANGDGAEAIYQKNCLSCHGDKLQGRVGPGTNLTKVGSRLSRDQILSQIADGGRGMPAFKGKLSEQEMAALADWLAEKK